MKKKGITLIETIVSVMILIVIITVLAGLVKSYKDNLKTRIIKENLNRVTYCVMQELKHNYSIEEIKTKANDGIIKMKNYDEVLLDLLTKPLFILDEGEGINIFINDYADNKLKIKVEVVYFGQNVDLSYCREFIKWR